MWKRIIYTYDTDLGTSSPICHCSKQAQFTGEMNVVESSIQHDLPNSMGSCGHWRGVPHQL